jgi:hypothetical protein
MTSIIIPQPTLVSSVRSYSPDEWEEKQQIIAQLYRGEGKTLKEARLILAEQHDFRPT